MEIIRMTDSPLREVQRRDLVEWVRSLGLDPKDIRPHFVITRDQDGSHTLHASRMLRDENGHHRIDVAAESVMTEPVALPVGAEPTWPGWLNAFTPDAPHELIEQVREWVRQRRYESNFAVSVDEALSELGALV